MSHGSVHVVRKAGVIDSAFNHQVYDALDDIPDHDSDDEAPETKDQYFEFSDAYGIMRLIRCIIYVQIVALILDNPALRISHMLDICCRGVLYYSIHFYSRPFLDVIYIVQLFGDGIAKFFISQNAPKTPDNVEVTPPGRRLNVNPYTSNGQLVENTPDLTFSLDVVQDQYWHTLQHFAHYFLGLMFVLLAVFFFVRFWEIKDYSERKGVKKWLHTYITDGWFRRGGKKIFFSLVTAVGTLGFFILCIHALTNSMGPDSLSNGLILSSLFAVGISIVAVLWLISVIWIRITEQTFVRYVSQNVAYTSVIILKRAIKAKMDIGLVLLVSLYMPVVYTLFEAQIPLLDWSDTLAESFRKGVNFYVPCYYAAFPPFKQTFLPPSTCPVASYSSPSQELGNSGFYYIQQTLQCDSFLGVCLHVLSTALSIYVILFYFYFFYRVIDQVVGEFRVSRWVDVLHKLIRIREEEVMEYQQRFPSGKRIHIAFQEEIQRQMQHAHKGCIWFVKTTQHLMIVLLRNIWFPIAVVLSPFAFLLSRLFVLVFMNVTSSPRMQKKLRKSFAITSTPSLPTRRRSSMFDATTPTHGNETGEVVDNVSKLSRSPKSGKSRRFSRMASMKCPDVMFHNSTKDLGNTTNTSGMYESEDDTSQWNISVKLKERADAYMKSIDVVGFIVKYASIAQNKARKFLFRSKPVVWCKMKFNMWVNSFYHDKRADGSIKHGIASLGAAYAPWRTELTLQNKTKLLRQMKEHNIRELRFAKRYFISDHELVISVLDYTLDTAGMMTLVALYDYAKLYYFLVVLIEMTLYVLVASLTKKYLTWSDRNLVIMTIDVLFGIITYVVDPYTEELDRWLEFMGRVMIFSVAVGLVINGVLSSDPNDAVSTYMYSPWKNADYLESLFTHPNITLYLIIDLYMVIYFYAYIFYIMSILGVFGIMDRVIISFLYRGHDHILDYLVYVMEKRGFGFENNMVGLEFLQQWDDIIKSQRKYALLTWPDVRPSALASWYVKMVEIKWASLFNLTLMNLKSSLGLTILHTAMFSAQTEAVRWIVFRNPELLLEPDSQNDSPVTIALKECAYYLLLYGEQNHSRLDDGTGYGDEEYAMYYPEVDELRIQIASDGEFIPEFCTTHHLTSTDLILLRTEGYYHTPVELNAEALQIAVAEEKNKDKNVVSKTAKQLAKAMDFQKIKRNKERQRMKRAGDEKRSLGLRRFPEDDLQDNHESASMTSWSIVGFSVPENNVTVDRYVMQYMKAHSGFHYDNFEHPKVLAAGEKKERDIEESVFASDLFDRMHPNADIDLQYVVPTKKRITSHYQHIAVPWDHTVMKHLRDIDQKPRKRKNKGSSSNVLSSDQITVHSDTTDNKSVRSRNSTAMLSILSGQDRVDMEANSRWQICKFAEILLSDEVCSVQEKITWEVSDFKAMNKLASMNQGRTAQHLALVCHLNPPHGFVSLSDWSVSAPRDVYFEMPEENINMVMKAVVSVVTNTESVLSTAGKAVNAAANVANNVVVKSWRSKHARTRKRRGSRGSRVSAHEEVETEGTSNGEEGMLSDRIIHFLAEALVASKEELVLNDCELSNNARRAWRAVCRALRRKYSSFIVPSIFTAPKEIVLKRLVLTRNELDCGDCVYIADVFTHQLTLEYIDVSYNHIGARGMMILCKAMRTHPNVKVWTMAHNNIGPAAGKDVGLFLKNNTSIKIFSVAYNHLGEIHRFPTMLSRDSIPSSAHDLCIGLKANKSLEQLNLSYNHLGPILADALPLAVNRHPCLHTLDISGNDLGPERGSLCIFAMAGAPRGAQYAKERDKFIAYVKASQLEKAQESKDNKEDMRRLMDTREAKALIQAADVLVEQMQWDFDDKEYSLDHYTKSAHMQDNELAIFGGSSPVKSKGGAVDAAGSLASKGTFSPNTSFMPGSSQLLNTQSVISIAQKDKSVAQELSDTYAAMMAKVNQPAHRLTALSIADNQLGAFAGHAIAHMLKAMKGLTHLDLSGNSLGPVGGERIADQFELLHEIVPRDFLKRVLYDIEERKFEGRNAKKRKKIYTNLLSLNLSRNNFGPKVMGSIMVSLGSPRCGIISLNVSDNPLGSSDQDIAGNASDAALDIREGFLSNQSLTHFYANNTKFMYTDLVTMFGGLCHHMFLQTLCLRDVPMDEPAALQLGNALQHVQTLTYLDIHNCQLGPNGGMIVATKLKTMFHKLLYMDLSGNYIGPVSAMYLSEGLRVTHPPCSLRTMLLANNDLLEEGGVYIAKALVGNISITDIDLSGNFLTHVTATHLADAVRGLFKDGVKLRDSSFKRFRCNDNPQIGRRGSRHIIKALANAMMEHVELRNIGAGPGTGESIAQYMRDPLVAWSYMDVTNNNLTRVGLNQIFWALRTNKRIRVIKAGENRAGTIFCADADSLLQHGIAVPKCIIHNTYIRELDLSYNSLTSEAGLNIFDALLQNCTIKKVSLRGNLLDDMIASKLSQLIDQNDVIEELDLGHNRMGFTCLFELSTVIASNRRLRIFIADNNHFGGAGSGTLESFRRAIMMNYALEVLNLDGNKFGPEWGIKLGEIFARNNTLVQVSLRNNRFDTRAGESLLKAYKHCPYLLELALTAEEIGASLWEEYRRLYNEKRASVDPKSLREEVGLSPSQVALLQSYHQI